MKLYVVAAPAEQCQQATEAAGVLLCVALIESESADAALTACRFRFEDTAEIMLSALNINSEQGRIIFDYEVYASGGDAEALCKYFGVRPIT